VLGQDPRRPDRVTFSSAFGILPRGIMIRTSALRVAVGLLQFLARVYEWLTKYVHWSKREQLAASGTNKLN
jgi:hypothetical protein